ncbi:ribonuclease P (protein C5) [Williamsoniiplasma somnilux]|uniref:Ribonuclease P protein component n=1 Tax=Williamsoniiplasma somnilux TaxID=215578 RepID=A0A2K8NZ53_9MOLU|nr:ribonuclease P protein component [Williamsoniiplasma somnilux]ATZ19110.1 ribonuclease P (protein C5) [Williamsoniiplasma somnilux]
MKNKNIIKGNFEFQKIISKQQFIKNVSFVVYYDKSKEELFKYGISVGKKMGNAVVRNKIKRQIRMMINNNINAIEGKKYRVIIMARANIKNTSFAKNQELLLKLLLSIK